MDSEKVIAHCFSIAKNAARIDTPRGEIISDLVAYKHFMGLTNENFADARMDEIADEAIYKNCHLHPTRDPWAFSSDAICEKELKPRKSLMVDSETGSTVFYASSINQLWAYRGQGKSVVALALAKCFITGLDWLRFRSPGGLRVMLVDGELPAIQIQERVKEFVGEADRRLLVMSPEFMMYPSAFPNLSDPQDQQHFLDRLDLDGEKPDVIIFDTLSRCFRFDTNDPDAWLIVNDFLVGLRTMGYCVIVVHHAGKNGTQRGRTDGDCLLGFVGGPLHHHYNPLSRR